MGNCVAQNKSLRNHFQSLDNYPSDIIIRLQNPFNQSSYDQDYHYPKEAEVKLTRFITGVSQKGNYSHFRFIFNDGTTSDLPCTIDGDWEDLKFP